MDGENNGSKPYEQMDRFAGFKKHPTPIFGWFNTRDPWNHAGVPFRNTINHTCARQGRSTPMISI